MALVCTIFGMECNCSHLQNTFVLHIDGPQHSDYLDCSIPDRLDSTLSNSRAHISHHCCTRHHERPCFLDTGQFLDAKECINSHSST